MSSNLKTIAFLGASSKTGPIGSFGTFVLNALTTSSEFDVTVIRRKSSKSTSEPSIKVITVSDRVSDTHSKYEMVGAFRGKDAVVLTSGHGFARKEVAIVDAAIQAGVKRFIFSEFSNNCHSQGGRGFFPMLAPKAQLVEYLKSKESAGMTWTAIITGPFIDWGLLSGFWGYDIAGRKAQIWESGNLRFSMTTRATVATSVVKVLNHPNETANKYLCIYSFETSVNSILASLEKATGGQKWNVRYGRMDDQITEGKEALSKADSMKARELALAASFKRGLEADFAAEQALTNDILGLPVEDFDTVIAEIAKSAKPS